VLLQLTQPGADVVPLLGALQVRTLLKWELLAASTALFACGFVGERRWQTVVAGLVAALAVVGGALTLVDPARYLVLLSMAITLVWLWQLGFAALALRGGRPAAAAP
jgi:hypothetical protein